MCGVRPRLWFSVSAPIWTNPNPGTHASMAGTCLRCGHHQRLVDLSIRYRNTLTLFRTLTQCTYLQPWRFAWLAVQNGLWISDRRGDGQTSVFALRTSMRKTFFAECRYTKRVQNSTATWLSCEGLGLSARTNSVIENMRTILISNFITSQISNGIRDALNSINSGQHIVLWNIRKNRIITESFSCTNDLQ